VRIPKRFPIRDLALVAAATTITNVASYLMSLAGARLLTPQEFGAFGALLGLSIIGSTLAIAAQTVAARGVAATDAAAAWRIPVNVATPRGVGGRDGV